MTDDCLTDVGEQRNRRVVSGRTDCGNLPRARRAQSKALRSPGITPPIIAELRSAPAGGITQKYRKTGRTATNWSHIFNLLVAR